MQHLFCHQLVGQAILKTWDVQQYLQNFRSFLGSLWRAYSKGIKVVQWCEKSDTIQKWVLIAIWEPRTPSWYWLLANQVEAVVMKVYAATEKVMLYSLPSPLEFIGVFAHMWELTHILTICLCQYCVLQFRNRYFSLVVQCVFHHCVILDSINTIDLSQFVFSRF